MRRAPRIGTPTSRGLALSAALSLTALSPTDASRQLPPPPGRVFLPRALFRHPSAPPRLPPAQGYDRPVLIGNRQEYERLYRHSIEDPRGFWQDMASQHFTWAKMVGWLGDWLVGGCGAIVFCDHHHFPPTPTHTRPTSPPNPPKPQPQNQKQWDANHNAHNFDMRDGPISIKWFKGAKTNITYNCLDRCAYHCRMLGVTPLRWPWGGARRCCCGFKACYARCAGTIMQRTRKHPSPP